MRGLSYLFKGLARTLNLVMIRPIRVIGRALLRSVLPRVYLTVYFPIKRRLIERFAFAKSKIWYPFASKYILHFFLLVMAGGVLAHSIKTRAVSAEEFGSDSLISQFIGLDNQIIEETANATPTTSMSYLNQKGLVGGSNLEAQGLASDESENLNLSLAQGGSSIVKPNIPTTEITDQPRELVDYYVVQGGDTVSTIADQFNVSTNTILWENRLGAKDYIKPGDKLTILPTSGVSHQIKKGDTIASIAKKYGVETQKIIDYNQLASADAIQVDQILIVPGGIAPETIAPAAPATGLGKYVSGGTPPPPARVPASQKMLWPTGSHRINQYFGFRHTGLDIDGNIGSPIYAAEGGRIEVVGWGKGYGLHVIINHGGGKKTLYGHFSKAYVNSGQQVNKGDSIGLMGCTGWCTGPHLHFEVIINGKKINPLSYL
ncbi:MAG: peptidoglycan DD-metalloendopeptidase family protein [Patescibacteria group bacterium]